MSHYNPKRCKRCGSTQHDEAAGLEACLGVLKAQRDAALASEARLTEELAEKERLAGELLEALRAQAGDHDCDGTLCFCGDTDGEHATFCRQGRAAIAKAEDRS